MPYLSVNSWALRRHLGPLRWSVWDAKTQQIVVREDPQPETTHLLDLPRELAARGYQAVDICHFHFPTTDRQYLQQLKEACTRHGIRFHTLLVDYGDISSADEVRVKADVAFIRSWIDIAAEAGAERIRIVAGESPAEDQEALDRSIEQLKNLYDYAKPKGVQVITENFRPLALTAANCLRLIQSGESDIGLITDFGNFKHHGERKYDELAAILPFSESVHAHALYDDNGHPNADEFRKCLDLLPASGFNGAIALVYGGPGDMWKGLDRMQAVVEAYL